jgi:tetratricopeptide (TPR) repeat protein
MGTKGPAAPETTAAVEQARLFIERAEALGDPSDNPLLLFQVLEGFWQASYVAFNGDAMRERAEQFVALARKQGAILPLIMGHRLMGVSLVWTGDLAEGRAHFDRAVALCDHAEHPLATRTGKDYWVFALSDRSSALWNLGYPDAALADAQRAVKDARDLGRLVAYAAAITSRVFTYCGNYAAANKQLDEAITWADENGAVFWKTFAMNLQGEAFAIAGKSPDAVQLLTSGIAAWHSMGSRAAVSIFLVHLAIAYANLGQFNDAWRCVTEAMAVIKTNKEKYWEAEINRVAGEIALKSPEADAAKAKTYFQRALTVARQQQAKSWELRASMSLARLWRDQGKVSEARELLPPVYGWFTEGFDTRDLKDAKALLAVLS